MTSFLKHKCICLQSPKQCQLSLLISPGLPQTPLALLHHCLAKGKTPQNISIEQLLAVSQGMLSCTHGQYPKHAQYLIQPVLRCSSCTFSSPKLQELTVIAKGKPRWASPDTAKQQIRRGCRAAQGHCVWIQPKCLPSATISTTIHAVLKGHGVWMTK